MRQRWMMALAAGAAALWISVTQAAEVDGLYESEVRVEDKGTEARNEAIAQAFRAVLVKVTGNRSVARRSQLADDIKRSASLVRQYRYRTRSLPAAGADGGSREDLLLNVLFDKAAVDRLLRNNGLPVWGSLRPQVLLWLGEESGGRRRIVAPDQDPVPGNTALGLARQRGLPLILPLMDLQDQNALPAADLFGAFERSIRAASERYGADAVLAGQLSRVSDKLWRGQWTLYLPQGSYRESMQSEYREGLVLAGAEWAADLLASRYAPAGAQSGVDQVTLRVEDVHGLRDFTRLRRMLAERDGIEQVRLRAAVDDSVLLSLTVRGGMSALKQALALLGRIEPMPEGLPAPPGMPVAPPGSGEPGAGEASGTEPAPVQAVDVASPGPVMDAQLHYRLLP